MQRSYYIYSEGQLLRKDNTLRFMNAEGETKDFPVEQVRDIYIMSQMNFNTAFLNILSQNGILVHFFNYYDFYIGSFYPREHLLAGRLLIKQTEFYTDFDKRLDLAKRFIHAASFNIYRNLRYYNSRGKDLKQAMEDIMYLLRPFKLHRLEP